MSLFSFLKRNKESYSLIFNIGSGSVSGGIARFTEKEGVSMAYYTKELVPFQSEISPQRHLELMKSTLAALAQKIRAEGFKLINPKKKNIPMERAFYIFSSPWSISQTKVIRIKEPKTFKITEGYLNRVVNEQEKQFQADISKTGKIIEKKIVQVKINGYAVTDIYNKPAKNLELSVFLTAVPEEILQAVSDAVAKTFSIKNSWHHSLMLAVFSVVRNLFPQNVDFIHLDVSEEITDISLIQDDVMMISASIPYGRNHFIRELSSAAKVPEELADSMVGMCCLKSSDESANQKSAAVMDGAAKIWLAKISDVLENFKEKTYVPDTIFLIANNNLVPFLKDKLQKMDFKVQLIDNKKIKSLVVIDDISFKLGLMFLDKLYKI